jgi:hypothetical protein
MEEVTGYWIKLHKEELCDVFFTRYYSGDKMTEDMMGETCST